MKKLLLVCCIVLGISTLSKAQGGGGGQGRQQQTPEQQLDRYKTTLALTDDQSAKVLVILKAQQASRDSLTKAGGDARTGMQPIRTAMTAKINAILTADQKTKFAAMGQGGRGGQGGGGGMGGGGGTPPPPTR